MKNFFKKMVVGILFFSAKQVLLRHKPVVIAITGSVGKTTTKDFVYEILKEKFKTRKSQKSFNSELGVPLTILGLPNAWNSPYEWIQNIIKSLFIAFFSKDYPETLVLEIGIDRPGDMEKITSWIKPDVVIMTRLPKIPVHVEYFKTPEDVIFEKFKLVDVLKSDGVFIYNHDDALIANRLSDVRSKTIGYSRYLSSDFTAGKDRIIYDKDNRYPTGVEFIIEHDKETKRLFIADTIGTQHIYAVLAALAVGNYFGIGLETSIKNLTDFKTQPGRMRLLAGIKSSLIIDDTYNSSPIALQNALETIGELQVEGRKIAILGDMLELGDYTKDEHYRLGKLSARYVNNLLVFGKFSKYFVEGALSAGMPESNIRQFDSVKKCGLFLQSLLSLGDVALVKASQGSRAEKIVLEVMYDSDFAEDLLVRQDKNWL